MESQESNFWRKYAHEKIQRDIFPLRQIQESQSTFGFQGPLRPTQENGRLVPIHIHQKVGDEIIKLMKEGHIVKLSKGTRDHFVASVVITANKVGIVKLAMDAEPMNAQIFKNQYQIS